MTQEELQNLIDKANAANNLGEYDKAELIAIEVLNELDNFSDSILSEPDGLSEYSSNSPKEVSDRIVLRTGALFVLVFSTHRRGMHNSALEQAEIILALAEKYSLDEVLPKAWNAIGNIHLHLGVYDKSLENYNKALNAFEKLGAKPKVATIISNIGLAYYCLGIYDKALEYNSKALAELENVGEKQGIANVMSSIGLIYNHLGLYDKSLEYFSEALSIYEELGEKPAIANILGSLGGVYLNLDIFDKSLEYFSEALSIHEALGEKSAIAREMGNIGNLYQNLGVYDKSLEFMLRALSIHEEIGAKPSSAIVMGCIGVLYSNEEFEGYDSAKAEEYLLKAIALNEELGVKHNLYENHKYISYLYKQEERWKDFALHLEKSYNIEKEVRSAEAEKQAEQLEYQRKIEESERDRQVKLARFQEQEKILNNILPFQIAERIIAGEKTIADTYDDVSVFFSDIVGFTKLSHQATAVELVEMLNWIFTQFDQIARKHGLEKIKTIGDAYMAVCGAPIAYQNHAERVALFALEVLEKMKDYRTNSGEKISIRMGIHTGSVVAGIIGENKFTYDMWGDTVNTASRMETYGEAGKIQVSEDFISEVERNNGISNSMLNFHFISRGEMDIKGKGIMKTYFLEKS